MSPNKKRHEIRYKISQLAAKMKVELSDVETVYGGTSKRAAKPLSPQGFIFRHNGRHDLPISNQDETMLQAMQSGLKHCTCYQCFVFYAEFDDDRDAVLALLEQAPTSPPAMILLDEIFTSHGKKLPKL